MPPSQAPAPEPGRFVASDVGFITVFDPEPVGKSDFAFVSRRAVGREERIPQVDWLPETKRFFG